MPISHFEEASHAPDYSEMRQNFLRSNGFIVFVDNHHDFFMHARRENLVCDGKFEGDKFHISVQKEQIPQVFKALSGLLFSEDSPIDHWKVTDIERMDDPQSRTAVGAQFTLYVKPDKENSEYSASSLHSIRQFVECIESKLSSNEVEPGQHPESDVHPANWQYVSYRNEKRSNRDGGKVQSEALRQEPFYRLMTESL